MENSIRLSSEGSLILEVTDTGIGIEADKIDQLFKPFSTASDDHHRNYGGTGLGLWISKVIIELMGGHVNVTSEIGKGSTFTFTIPIHYYRSQ